MRSVETPESITGLVTRRLLVMTFLEGTRITALAVRCRAAGHERTRGRISCASRGHQGHRAGRSLPCPPVKNEQRRRKILRLPRAPGSPRWQVAAAPAGHKLVERGVQACHQPARPGCAARRACRHWPCTAGQARSPAGAHAGRSRPCAACGARVARTGCDGTGLHEEQRVARKAKAPQCPRTWAAARLHAREGPGDLLTRVQERGAAMLPAARRAAARLVLSRVAEAYGRMLLQDGCGRAPHAALSEPAQWAPVCGDCPAPAAACLIRQRCPRQSRLLQGRSRGWPHGTVRAWLVS